MLRTVLLNLLPPNKHGGARYISTIAVIGGGVMGSGIAQVAASNGNRVYVYDLTDPFLEGTQTSITKSLEKIAGEKFKGDKAKADEYVKNAKSKLNFTTDLKAAFDNTELVIEAIYENLEAKRRLFSKLENEKIADPHTIFASNTLNLSITDIAVHSRRKDKFAGVRFFFPVPRTKTAEITRTSETSDDTVRTLTDWVNSLGKYPVPLIDTPGGGGIVNRLPHFRKAIGMLERGDASKEDIDLAMKHSNQYAKGPLEIMDSIGLDLVLNTIETLAKRYPNDANYSVPELLKRMVAEGKLGVKKGEGFYSYK
jgi:3-hydroxyacyl-CoA dehydrogenase